MVNEYKIKNDIRIIVKSKNSKSSTKYFVSSRNGIYHFKYFSKDDSFALYIPEFASQVFDSVPMLDLKEIDYAQILTNTNNNKIVENHNTYQILNSGFQFNYSTIKIHLAYCFDKVVGLSLFHN